MPDRHLLVKREGAITTITLNHPERRNALSLELMTELIGALREAGDSDALGVVLAANGPAFSAGHDFRDMHGADVSEIRKLFRRCTEMMDLIQDLPQPVVAKVHAIATAAGCQLVATCDLVVASEEARFALSGVKSGLFCHTPLVAVARSVGRKRALELAMTGDVIDAHTAADWGLVNRVVPAAELDDATYDLISRATCGTAEGTSLGKHGFYAQIDLPQASAYDVTIELIAAAAASPDAQAEFTAFLEKRKAVR